MVVELPKVKIGDRSYYQDDRLKEFRATDNPHDRITYEEFFGKRETGPDCLELIGERWGKVRRGTHVFLFEGKEFPTFEGRTHKLDPGIYEVEGFYADAVKLTQGGGYPRGRDFVIPSIRLRAFSACKVR